MWSVHWHGSGVLLLLRDKRFRMSNTPDFNPYESLLQPRASYHGVGNAQPKLGHPNPHHAWLGFIECFVEAKKFLGKDYWLFWGLTCVGMLIAGAIPFILQGPIYCGLGLCFLAVERRQQPSFELMFKGFNDFMNTLTPVLYYALCSFPVIILYLLGVLGGMFLCNSRDPILIALGIVMFLFALSVLIVGLAFIGFGSIFACFLIAEYKLTGMDAFNISLKGLQKNIFGMIGVTIAAMIVTICAMLLCYIPLLLMLPIYFCVPFICYRKIFREQGTATKQLG